MNALVLMTIFVLGVWQLHTSESQWIAIKHVLCSCQSSRYAILLKELVQTTPNLPTRAAHRG